MSSRSHESESRSGACEATHPRLALGSHLSPLAKASPLAPDSAAVDLSWSGSGHRRTIGQHGQALGPRRRSERRFRPRHRVATSDLGGPDRMGPDRCNLRSGLLQAGSPDRGSCLTVHPRPDTGDSESIPTSTPQSRRPVGPRRVASEKICDRSRPWRVLSSSSASRYVTETVDSGGRAAAPAPNSADGSNHADRIAQIREAQRICLVIRSS